MAWVIWLIGPNPNLPKDRIDSDLLHGGGYIGRQGTYDPTIEVAIIASGSELPVSPKEGDVFYRTADDGLYVAIIE